MATTNVYVLKLTAGKWYVGTSKDVLTRYQQHLNGNGSSWTKLYTPIEITETIENVSPFEEDKKTKELMAKYGIDNVRGGTYVSEKLDEVDRETLQIEIWAAQGRCRRCGRTNHFVKDCRAHTDINGDSLDESDTEEDVWGCEFCDAEFQTESAAEKHETRCKNKYQKSSQQKVGGTCFRCGRPGHYANNCYARTTVRGYELDSSDDE